MAKTWILDSETKGTGAHVVPLEKVEQGRGPEPELNRVVVGRPVGRQRVAEPEPRRRRRFKVLDVMTRENLAEGVDLKATLELLGEVRSIVDVHVYAWDGERRRWRLLGLGEQRALWEARRHPVEPASQ